MYLDDTLTFPLSNSLYLYAVLANKADSDYHYEISIFCVLVKNVETMFW